MGLLVAGAVFGTLAWAIGTSGALGSLPVSQTAPPLPVQAIGEHLTSELVLPLEALALLLTAALIGAVVIALPDRPKPEAGPGPSPTPDRTQR